MVDLGEGADLVHKPWNHSVEMEPVVESTLRSRKQAPNSPRRDDQLSRCNFLLSRVAWADVFKMAYVQMYSTWRPNCSRAHGRISVRAADSSISLGCCGGPGIDR